jgi:hypothetical protein
MQSSRRRSRDLYDGGSGGWCDGRGVGVLQESKCVEASLTFAGPNGGTDVDCTIGESEIMYEPCIAELPAPGMGAIFTTTWTSGAGAKALCFFVGGWSFLSIFGRRVFVAVPSNYDSISFAYHDP